MKTRRNGRRIKKQRRTQLEGEERGWGKAVKRGKRQEEGDACPCCQHGVAPVSDGRARDCSKRGGGSTRGEGETAKQGKRQGLCHPCSLKTALAAFSNSSEMEVRGFEASFYLARFYSNLPWAQKHSFSICQKVVLLTLKCQTVIGG